MKAIHNETNAEYHVVNIMGEKIHLRSFSTGKDKKIEYDTFKSDYRLADDSEEVAPFVPDLEDEIKEANERADEILKEAENSKKKPEVSATVVRIDFSEKKDKPKKEREPRASKPKADKGNVTTLKDICDELKMDPSKARRILRKKITDRDGGSWEWSDPKEIEKIKGLLK